MLFVLEPLIQDFLLFAFSELKIVLIWLKQVQIFWPLLIQWISMKISYFLVYLVQDDKNRPLSSKPGKFMHKNVIQLLEYEL